VSKRRPLGPPRKRRGRPFVHEEAWSKVSVVLLDRQVAALDRLVSDMREATGKAQNRAGVIRALVDGLLDSGWTVAATPTERELRTHVAKRLRVRS
jgi:hypothetical protein